MNDSYGFIVCARISTPRNQHPWTYEPLSAVSFDLGAVQRCFEGLIDPKRAKPPAHPVAEAADGFVLAELVPVSLTKPAWLDRDQLEQSPAPRRVNERLVDIIDLDEVRA